MTIGTRALPRVLGLFGVTVLAAAAMGPAYSLASTMGPMVAAAGAYAPLALVLLALIMLCIAVAFSQLTAVYPDAGSSFSWIARAFGSRAGAYGAWLLLLSNYFATMATALPAGIYTLDLFAPRLAASPLWDAAIGVVWIAASAALLSLGLRPTALATTIFLAAEFAVIGAAALAALTLHPALQVANASAPPDLRAKFGGIVAAMVLGIWLTDGWEVSASASEETSGSRDTAGRGGIAGLILTTLVLLFAMIAFLHAGTFAGFTAHQADAMTYVAERLGGGVWRVAIVATVLVSTAATLWTTLLYLSRSVYAMGRDGVLPRALGALDARLVPANALYAISFGVSAFTLLTGFSESAAKALTLVLNGSAVFLGLLFCASASAAIRLLAARPGSAPFSTVIVPAAGALGLLAIILADVASADRITQNTIFGGLLLGVLFALWRGRHVSLSSAAALSEPSASERPSASA